MSITVLLQKLIEVEQSIGVRSEIELRIKVQEAQDYALQMQKERVEHLLKQSGFQESGRQQWIGSSPL